MAESPPSAVSDGQDADELLEGSVVGRFRIGKRVGRGGMGEVYRAEDTRLKRLVAVKRLTPSLRKDPLYRRRFLEEAERASRLTHPHVAAIYDVIEENNEIFLVMEFVEGETLRDRLGRPVTLETFLDIALQCADALIGADQAGVIHGDIKPENIMLNLAGQVKILDFGLAKNLHQASQNSTIDRAGSFAGTPAYMAPELLMEKPADGRADIFSLGVVFYEVLTAHHPFQAENFLATCDRIRRETPAPIQKFNPKAPSDLQAIVGKMLAKVPEQRYKDARELLQDLRYVHQSNSHPELVLPSWAPKSWWRRILTPALASMLGVGLLLGAYESPWVQRWMSPPPPLKRKFLAVLPFTTVAGDPLSRAFSDGVSETLAMRLTQLTATYPVEVVSPREIRVASVADAEQARKVFGANLALEGSLSQSDHRIRVSYSLVDTATRHQVRADSVTVDENSGALQLEDRLVESVMSVLGVELKPNDREALRTSGTAEPAAYDDYLRGRGYLQDSLNLDSLDSAIGLFRQAVKRDPKYALASAGLGEAYWYRYFATGEQSSIPQALENCQHAAKWAETLADGHICLGVVYNGTGQYENAVTEFQRALSLDVTNDEAFRGLASAYEKLNRADDAEKTFLEAIKMRPQYWGGCAWLGGFYFRHARYDEAARMYTEWIALAPDSFKGYSNLGGVYIEQGRYGDAVPQFRRSVDINPNSSAYSNLASAFFYQGNFAEAARNYKEAMNVSGTQSDDFSLPGNLAEAYFWMPGRQQEARELYSQAVSRAKKFLEVNPRDGVALSYLGLYYAMLSERDKAEIHVQRALRSAPEDPEVHLNAAKAEARLGERAAALAILATARKLGVSPFMVRDDPVFRSLALELQIRQLAQR